MFELKTTMNQALNGDKIKEYLSLVFNQWGFEEAHTIMLYVIIVASKYLTMMASYYLHENEPQYVEKIYSWFNEIFYTYCDIFQEVTNERIRFSNTYECHLEIAK